MKESTRTLDGLVAAIRSSEQQASKKRATRDRLLAQAHEAALEVAALAEQCAGLREIFGELDAQAYEHAFGEPFTLDRYHNVEPSREQLLAGLRDTLAFFEATPEVPLTHDWWSIDLDDHESDAERIAAVDAVAMFLGEDPEYRPHYSGSDRQQYQVKRMFGHVRVQANVTIASEPEAAAKDLAEPVDVGQAHAQPAVRDEVLHLRMLGMGGPAEDSADGDVMHAAAYAGPGFGLESAHALCGGKGWLTEDVSLVTCTACAALLLGDAVEENADDGAQGVVDAYLEGQSEADQALVREELNRQAETESQPCPQCGGSGLHADGVDVGSGDEPVVCERCGGLGTIPRGGFCADCGKKHERVIPCVNQDGEQFTLCPDCVESRSGSTYATADNTGDVEITSAVTA